MVGGTAGGKKADGYLKLIFSTLLHTTLSTTTPKRYPLIHLRL